MQRILASFLGLLVLGLAGTVNAQTNTPVPSKKIIIYNNSAISTIYPVISAGKWSAGAPGVAGLTDLWMQAQFAGQITDYDTQGFHTTRVYRAFINPKHGIPPKKSVEITVPFYTQLKQTTQPPGVESDVYVDWWNSMRIYFFDGPVAVKAALITNNTTDGPPQPIVYLPGQAVPSCYSTNVVCEDGGSGGAGDGSGKALLLSYTIDPDSRIPFQLQEYTFASAEGPPPGGLLPAGSAATINLGQVNYNVSTLDSVYLPVAMGPYNNPAVKYVGTAQTVKAFRAHLAKFADNGAKWPFFIPAYFDDPANHTNPIIVEGAACSLAPFTDPYPLPKIPGTFNLLQESYRDPPPTPPVISSQPPNYRQLYSADQCVLASPAPYGTPNLGSVGQAMVKLWASCTSPTSPTCADIMTVSAFFLQNFAQTCGATQPDQPSIISAVYGWVPITYPLYPKPGQTVCSGGPLKDTANFTSAIEAYCRLQYNYLDLLPGDPNIFNPYVELIHDTLASTGYAFSIDDKTAFKSVKGDGVIIAIAGVNGLENHTASPLPNKGNYLNDYCKTAP